MSTPAATRRDPLKDADLLRLAREIVDYIFDCADKAEIWLEDRRNEGINPFYNQLTDGLWLRHYYGIPGSIPTPWGDWCCFGSGSGDAEAFWQLVSEQIELEETVPVRITEMGEFCPYYRIVSFRGQPLPQGERRNPGDEDYLSYEDAKAAFADVRRTLPDYPVRRAR